MSNTNVNADQTNYTNGMTAITTGKTGQFVLTNITFFNYPSGSLVLQTCRFCDDPLEYTNLGTELFVSKFTFNNINGKNLFMIGLKRDVIYDEDGSFSTRFDGSSRTSGTIVHGFNHIASFHQNTCPAATTPTNWDDAIMCDNTQTVRRVFFTNIADRRLFSKQYMKVTQLTHINDTTSETISSTLYTQIKAILPTSTKESKDKAETYALPFVMGNIYNIWWGIGIDFSHLSIVTTPLMAGKLTESVIFKFNYTQNREFYNIGPMIGGARTLTQLDYISESPTYLDMATCNNGDHYHDNT